MFGGRPGAAADFPDTCLGRANPNRPDPGEPRVRAGFEPKEEREMIETGGVLETIEDDRGAVTIGWLQRKVLYARFEGELSVELGVAHLTRMRELLGSVSALRYFSDASK